MNNKVNIGFISKGLNAYFAHIKPFVDFTSGKDYNYFIFHINKLYSPEVSINDDRVKCIDLLKNPDFRRQLLNNKIDVMISLNPGNIFDLFFLTVCKLENIFAVYYQHGIQLDFRSFDAKLLNQNKSLDKTIMSLKRYIFFYGVFFYNTLRNRRRKILINSVWKKTKHLFISKNRITLPKYGLKSNHCDLAFVYGERDKDYLMRSMDMLSEKIIISGYPFIEPLNSVSTEHSGENKLLYISSALRHVGVIPITKEEEKAYYQNLYDQVQSAGYELIIKLHPQEDFEVFKSYFKESQNLRLYKDTNLADLVIDSDIVAGDYSTAMFYGIKYYKPLVIIQSEFFKDYPFDFTKFDIGVKTSINGLSKLLSQGIEINSKIYQSFLRNYLSSKNGKSLYWNFYNCINNLYH